MTKTAKPEPEAKPKKAMIVVNADYWPNAEEAAWLESKGVEFPDAGNRRLFAADCPEEGFPMDIEKAKAFVAEGKGHWPPHIVEVD